MKYYDNSFIPSFLRLLSAIFFCLLLIIFHDKITFVQRTFNTLLSPIQYIVSYPITSIDNFFIYFSSKKKLIAENNQLKKEQLLLSENIQRYDFIKNENTKLLSLLKETQTITKEKLITKVIEINTSPYQHEILIDKGKRNNVYQGQTVLNQFGIIGQIIEVKNNFSKVLLLSDIKSAIPIVTNNDLHAILEGTGSYNRLKLSFVEMNSNIHVNDILYSSGLGNTFPRGYPVAKVTEINTSKNSAFLQISAQPIANLNQLNYLLLIWNTP